MWKRKLPRVISSWKSERRLWLKFQLNRSIFLFSSLKSVTINYGFFNLLLDIWIRDPDSEYGFGPNLNADPTVSGSETLHPGNGSGCLKKKIKKIKIKNKTIKIKVTAPDPQHCYEMSNNLCCGSRPFWFGSGSDFKFYAVLNSDHTV